jgi:hypothetical protein
VQDADGGVSWYMFGMSILLSRGSRVRGDISFASSHFVISGRLYVKPSAARTGSVISSPVNVVSQSSTGGRVQWVGTGESAGEDCMVDSGNDNNGQ